MKLPAWILGTFSTLFTAAVIGGFAWAWNLNAATSSNKATMEALNSRVIDNKENTNADIKDLKDLMETNRKENKTDHEQIMQAIRRSGRNHNEP